MPFGVGDRVLLVDTKGRSYTDPLYEIMQIDASRQLPYRLEMCGSRHRSTWVDATALRAWHGFAIGQQVQLQSFRNTKPPWHGARAEIIDIQPLAHRTRQFKVKTDTVGVDPVLWVSQCVLRTLDQPQQSSSGGAGVKREPCRMPENGAAAGPKALLSGAAAGPAAPAVQGQPSRTDPSPHACSCTSLSTAHLSRRDLMISHHIDCGIFAFKTRFKKKAT